MVSNIDRYKEELDRLIEQGFKLWADFKRQWSPTEFSDNIKNFEWGEDETKNFIEKLPNFDSEYQSWYSESLRVLKQLLPERFDDFVNLYKKNPKRKSITHENYVIEDALFRLEVSQEGETIVDGEAASLRLEQQVYIVESVGRMFESKLSDIKNLVQADLFDSKIEAAKELNRKGFVRGAGAVAGVVLESHLKQVCAKRNIKVKSTKPTIGHLNKLLEDSIETDVYKKLDYLNSLRIKCDHDKEVMPTKDEVDELISGVYKIVKNLS